eukprot:jgi/Mesvir1/21297/Mv21688-RA.1
MFMSESSFLDGDEPPQAEKVGINKNLKNAAAIRPVSARTLAVARPGSAARASPREGSGGDLFGSEIPPQSPRTPCSPSSTMDMTPAQRMQALKERNAQKRKDRSLSGSMVVSNDSMSRSRPGSALGRPGSALGQHGALSMSSLSSSLDSVARETAAETTSSSIQELIQEKQSNAQKSSAQPQASQRSAHSDSHSQEQDSAAPSSGAEEVERNLLAHGVSSVYDPTTLATPQSAQSGPRGSARGVDPGLTHSGSMLTRAITSSRHMDVSDIRMFLMQPGPKDGPILCQIIRDKGKQKMFPKFSLMLDNESKRFLLSARKRKKSKSSNYLISLDEEDMSRQSGNFFGKLRSNFVGTEFTIYDKGAKPKDADHTSLLTQMAPRQELGAVIYQFNVMGTRGPRKMTAMIPRIGPDGQRVVVRPGKDGEGMLEQYKKNAHGEHEDLVIMRNNPPKWNEQLQAYCLNFNGRVTAASVKNFQLVEEKDGVKSPVILQFGKIDKDVFTMDYQYPMSAFQAFCICLASFDNKLACE